MNHAMNHAIQGHSFQRISLSSASRQSCETGAQSGANQLIRVSVSTCCAVAASASALTLALQTQITSDSSDRKLARRQLSCAVTHSYSQSELSAAV